MICEPASTSRRSGLREVFALMAVIGDRWSMPVILELGDRGRLRRADLWRGLDGVSQKVLTTCLRRLEARGFVRRIVEATEPVSVSYELTDAGRSFFEAFVDVRVWAEGHAELFDPGAER